MAGKKYWLVPLLLALVLLVGGCADGVIYQKQHDDGRVDRLRLDTGESWDSFDTTPRYRSQKSKDLDDYCIMLKNEAIF